MGKCLSKTVETAVEIIQEENQLDTVQDTPTIESSFDLQKIDPAFVPKVPFKDQEIEIKIIKVYDGDTIHALLSFNEMPVRFSIRMLGIDTPELKSGKGRLKEEKIAATICRDYLKDLLKDGAKLIVRKWDKYAGRILGDIILADKRNATEVMIQAGYGREYFGDKKKDWTLKELTASPYDNVPRDLNLDDSEDDDFLE